MTKKVHLAIGSEVSNRVTRREQIKAEVFGDWCVHKAPESEGGEEWRVSHAPSGLRVMPREVTREQARRIARLLRDRMVGIVIDHATGVVSGDATEWRCIAESVYGEVLA
jgi:hypothetical protein